MYNLCYFQNGSLVVESYRAVGPALVFNMTKYCIDWFIDSENKLDYNAFVCHIQHYDFERHFILTGSCKFSITCFCFSHC